MSNDLTLYQNIAQSPNAVEQIQKLGEMWGKSMMFGTTRAEQGIVLLTICMTENMTPTEVNKKYHIMNGMLSRKAGSALAEFKKMGGKYRWTVDGMGHYDDPMQRYAECVFTLDDESYTIRFSMMDAWNAGYIKEGSNWVREPWKNLRARVITNGLGMIAPEIFFGDDPDESPMVDVTPAQEKLFKQHEHQPQPQSERNENKSEPIQDAEVIDDGSKSQRREYKMRADDPQPDNPKSRPVVETTNNPTRAAEQPTAKPKADAKPQPPTEGVVDAQPTPKAQPGNSVLNPLQQQVAKIMGDRQEQSMDYLRRELGWDQEGNGIAGLSEAECKHLIKYADDFNATIDGLNK